MGAQFVKQNDTGPVLERQLRWDPPVGARQGDPVDLTTASEVIWIFTHRTRAHAVHAGLPDAAQGRVSTQLPAEVSAVVGLWQVEIQVTWTTGAVETWPRTPRSAFDHINVVLELATPAVIADANTNPAL